MEDLNEELIEINEGSTEKLKETKEIPSAERNTKKDIIDKIYRLTEEYNIECKNTEKQFLRWSRKRLLKYLAETIEETCRLKIKGEELNISPECVDFAAQLPMLKMAHSMLCHFIEKSTNYAFTSLKYDYELRNYAKRVSENPLLDPILLEIGSEIGPELLSYLSNPYLKLLFVHGTCMFGCVINKKETMVSPRLNMSILNNNK